MKFRNYIEDIDFDGAELESISRNGNTIDVIFNNCILFSRHPSSSEYKGKINILAIAFNNVSNEQLKKFIGTGVSEPYSGEKPLETIEIFSKEGTYFEFGGYVDGEPWYQWSFNADSYEGSY